MSAESFLLTLDPLSLWICSERNGGIHAAFCGFPMFFYGVSCYFLQAIPAHWITLDSQASLRTGIGLLSSMIYLQNTGDFPVHSILAEDRTSLVLREDRKPWSGKARGLTWSWTAIGSWEYLVAIVLVWWMARFLLDLCPSSTLQTG